MTPSSYEASAADERHDLDGGRVGPTGSASLMRRKVASAWPTIWSML